MRTRSSVKEIMEKQVSGQLPAYCSTIVESSYRASAVRVSARFAPDAAISKNRCKDTTLKRDFQIF
mgnify:CR=1 FL=1